MPSSVRATNEELQQKAKSATRERRAACGENRQGLVGKTKKRTISGPIEKGSSCKVLAEKKRAQFFLGGKGKKTWSIGIGSRITTAATRAPK